MDARKKQLQNLLRLAQELKKTSPILLLLLCLAPLCLVIFYLDHQNEQLEMRAQRIESLESKAALLRRSQLKQESSWALAQNTNPHYLQSLETMLLLQPELHRVQALSRQYPDHRELQQRRIFLQGDQNKIQFIQTTERPGPFFKETEHQMQKTVQMNEGDLKTFLSSLEVPAEGRPLLVIKEFELKKLKEKGDETVYEVHTSLIQRAP